MVPPPVTGGLVCFDVDGTRVPGTSSARGWPRRWARRRSNTEPRNPLDAKRCHRSTGSPRRVAWCREHGLWPTRTTPRLRPPAPPATHLVDGPDPRAVVPVPAAQLSSV
ncbi:hypothetical protein [Amycolatopsis sp. cmx-4-61]|uniref:hypothetical protein n=1 Tax=Amycolatopsis sp. cmx-4-61 TaxID=2790937 RepID=UPI003978F294